MNEKSEYIDNIIHKDKLGYRMLNIWHEQFGNVHRAISNEELEKAIEEIKKLQEIREEWKNQNIN